MFIIKNDGQRIISTNYFDSEHAKNGFVYLSWNAGAARLLIPDSLKPAIREMKSAKYVVISRGPLVDENNRDAVEIMFEDGSDSPYCLILVTEQADRMLPETEQGGGFVVAAWTRSGMKLRLPGKYRTVDNLPCVEPWVEN